MHLPTQAGGIKRKIQIFKPLPQSTISGIFGFFGGVQAEYKDYEKILSLGDGREVTRVKTMGEVNL
jgi:B9 domain-containing protein 1